MDQSLSLEDLRVAEISDLGRSLVQQERKSQVALNQPRAHVVTEFPIRSPPSRFVRGGEQCVANRMKRVVRPLGLVPGSALDPEIPARIVGSKIFFNAPPKERGEARLRVVLHRVEQSFVPPLRPERSCLALYDHP